MIIIHNKIYKINNKYNNNSIKFKYNNNSNNNVYNNNKC